MSSCSEVCRKVSLALSFLVGTLGSIGYSFYLIWLLAHLKDNNYYWFFAFIPALFIVPAITAVVAADLDLATYSGMCSVLLTVMCTFTMLTRQAYYHLSPDDSIGPTVVINSLKASIISFISTPLFQRRCQLHEIKKDKDILSRGLLDFVDIFELSELLSLNSCVGVGSSVTEASPLENAIQAFCVMSFWIISIVSIPSMLHRLVGEPESRIWGLVARQHMSLVERIVYGCSLLLQNLPFLILRIILWAKYGIFSLGLMVKNVFAIVICIEEIKAPGSEKSDDQSLESRPPIQLIQT